MRVHGLHLAFLGCYGNDWVATPTIDRLAAEGIVFDQHLADSLAPGPPTIWTGRYRFDFAHATGGVGGMTPRLLRRLLQAGIPVCCARVTVADLSSTAELFPKSDQTLLWLETSLTLPQPDSGIGNDPSSGPDVPSPVMAEQPRRVGDGEETDPLRRLQESYAAVVREFDAALAGLVETLHRRCGDTIWVVVTAASGLGLGEHGFFFDERPWPHEELIHLALIVRRPEAQAAGWRVASLTQPIDWFPTLLELFELSPVPSQGQSLLPLLQGEEVAVRDLAVTALGRGGEIEWAVRTSDWALILPVRSDRRPQLYVKPEDRWEVNDVRQHHLEEAERLEEVLRRFAASTEAEAQEKSSAPTAAGPCDAQSAEAAASGGPPRCR
ncbi:MAG: sulfatase-like hydrolase/transferase [Gemmataceae bacterium]|nr:sulfatase-like hydrolase/transferase [Gemmataceae bacterium]MDW8264267.1 sulfatase-like hydrolase/transferase [Gemmataceae bacterium]